MQAHPISTEPLAKESWVKNRKKVVFDETRFVRKSPASLPEPILNWCERTLPTSKFDPSAPDRGGDMRPSNRAPARYQNAAKNHEEYKDQVQEDSRVSEDSENHGKRIASLSQKPVDFRPNVWG